MTETMSETHREMFDRMNTTVIQECLAILEGVAGYKLDPADRQPFLYFHNFLTNPQPVFISELRANPKLEKWYSSLVNGILGDVQNCLACVLYHAKNLERLEKSILELIDRTDFQTVIGDSIIGGGNTLVLDFEYQAFVLAYRRCLDYWTRAVSFISSTNFILSGKLKNRWNASPKVLSPRCCFQS